VPFLFAILIDLRNDPVPQVSFAGQPDGQVAADREVWRDVW
jgi:hypothetical protein